MKSRVIAGCFALGLIVVGTGWYALRVEMEARHRVSHAILARLDQRNQDSLLLSQKIGATTRVLAGLRADLGRMFEQLNARVTDLSPLVANEEPLSLAEEDSDQYEDTETLPPLPKEVAPRFLLSRFRDKGDLGGIILNPQLNPEGKKPDPIEEVMILREVMRANARIDMLHADLQLGVAEARAVLAAAGEYTDYAPGEEYMRQRDAVSLGERTEDGSTRMYYMYPEEFPEIHEMRAEQTEVADRAIRRIMSILQ